MKIDYTEPIAERLRTIKLHLHDNPALYREVLKDIESSLSPEVHQPGDYIDVYQAQIHCYLLLREMKAAQEVAQTALELVTEYEPFGLEHGRLLKSLGDIDFTRGRHSDAIGHYSKAEEIFQQSSTPENITACLICLGNCYSTLGNHKSGLEYFTKALAAARQSQYPDGEITALMGKANVYTFMGLYAEALERLQLALKLSEQKSDIRRQASIIVNIALALQKMGNLDEALDCNLRALKLIHSFGDRQRESIALLNIGTIYFQKGNLPAALEYFQDSLKARIEIDDLSGQGVCLNNIGSVYGELGRYDEALDFLLKSLEIRINARNIRGQAVTLIALGDVMFRMGDYEKAVNYFKNALEISEQAELTETEYEAHTELLKVLKVLGRPEQALIHAERGFELYKKMFNSQSELRSTGLRIQFETENALKDAEIERLKNIDLAQINQRLTALSDERREFISIAAHDLKNPLHSMKMMLNMLKTSEPGSDDHAEYLHEIESATSGMLSLIQNLLDTEMIESGHLALMTEPFQADEIVEYLLSRYETPALDKDIVFFKEIDPTVQILADVRYIVQVLDNVVSNAVKYSPRGKSITIRLFKSNGAARIEVQDEGAGFTREDMSRLFGKFQRLSARPTAGEHSTGLGLSIAKKLTEAMNGKIWCESESGKGSVFIMQFPIVEF
ncbi:MAG: tetratricopeptide repeat-containing sensor histidine kinase [Bacteroidota bacterium]